MEMYLNMKEIIKRTGKEFFIKSGFYKLFIIRQMSIHYRHLLKYKNKIDVKEKFLQYFDEKDILDRYNKRIEILHKWTREPNKNEKFVFIFDFDKTITAMVNLCKQKGFDIPTYFYHQTASMFRKIIKKDFYDLFISDEFLKKIEFHIVSASGNEQGIKNYLRQNNIYDLFKSINACSGELKKINKIKEMVVNKKRNHIYLIVDDDKQILNVCKLFFIIPLWCDKKGRLKTFIESV